MLEKIYNKHILKILIFTFILNILTLVSVLSLGYKIKSVEVESLPNGLELINDGYDNNKSGLELENFKTSIMEIEERITEKLSSVDNNSNNFEIQDFQNVLSDSENRLIAKIESNVVSQEDIKRWIDEALEEKITSDNKNLDTKMSNMTSYLEGKFKETIENINDKLISDKTNE